MRNCSFIFKKTKLVNRSTLVLLLLNAKIWPEKLKILSTEAEEACTPKNFFAILAICGNLY